MRKTLIAIAVAALAVLPASFAAGTHAPAATPHAPAATPPAPAATPPAPAAAPDPASAADVARVVNQFVDAFNKGDAKASLACAAETSIIDEFPPYAWSGPGACATWLKDYDADAKKNLITNGKVKLAKPRHIDIVGDRAYLVAAADYIYERKGKLTTEIGSTLSVALQHTEAGWRITAWSWAKR
jgi:hypothetical protein